MYFILFWGAFNAISRHLVSLVCIMAVSVLHIINQQLQDKLNNFCKSSFSGGTAASARRWNIAVFRPDTSAPLCRSASSREFNPISPLHTLCSLLPPSLPPVCDWHSSLLPLSLTESEVDIMCLLLFLFFSPFLPLSECLTLSLPHTHTHTHTPQPLPAGVPPRSVSFTAQCRARWLILRCERRESLPVFIPALGPLPVSASPSLSFPTPHPPSPSPPLSLPLPSPSTRHPSVARLGVTYGDADGQGE